ncbi:MAG: hypothetical protein K2N43_08315, partial [Lachnospiraceae bacterium]|nr:hypothetical protein [Lachnospiraceae bacterium]
MKRKMLKSRITALLLSMMLLALTACGGQTAAGQPAEAETETNDSLPTTDPSGASVVIPGQVDSVVAL